MGVKRAWAGLMVVGTVIAAWAALSAPAGVAGPLRLRVGQATHLPGAAHFTTAVSAQRRLRLTVILRPRHAAALQAFATAVSTPGTRQYGHYLSVAQFAQRFGASPAAVAQVRRALRAQGLRVGATPADRLTLPVTGTVGQVQHAFAVTEEHVHLAGGRVAFANREAPTVPAAIAGTVQGVIGLDDLVRVQPLSVLRPTHRLHRAHASAVVRPQVATGGPVPNCVGATDQQGNNGGSGYTADQIAAAYGFSHYYLSGDTGAGQTIAMFELVPYDPQDIATYQSCYSTSVPVSNVTIDGGPGTYGSSGHTDDAEPALDIEQAITTAPGSHILVYLAPNNASGDVDNYSAIINQDQAKIVSVSYGLCEARGTAGGGATIKSENTLFQQAAAQGQSIFVASGDQGSAACDNGGGGDTTPGVDDPASQPYATAVGGTALYSGNNQTAQYYTGSGTASEGVWNEGDDGSGPSATGGGLSTQWAMPSYQSSAASSLGVINSKSIVNGISCGSTYCREVPDVAADADPVTGYVFNTNQNQGGGWGVIGGTSAAAPLWAGFTALVNAQAACRGRTVGFANPDLYSIAGSAYLSNFNDVNQGSVNGNIGYPANNDAEGVNGGLFPTTANYDMTTGIGSMIGGSLGPSLCALVSPAYTVSVASPGNQSGKVGTAVNLTVHGTDSGGQPLSFAATGLPAGLSMNSAGTITGTPTTAQTTTVTVTASDAVGNSGSAQFSWTIAKSSSGGGGGNGSGQGPTGTASVAGLGKGKPHFGFTLTAGANALKSVSIGLPGGLSFATKIKTLVKGLTVRSTTHLTYSVKVTKHLLTITFSTGTRRVAVSLVKPALTISSSEASKIRRHKVKKLTFKVKATDTAHKTSALTVTFTKLS